MSSIDERIVSMKFNNSQFENGIRQSNNSLKKLKGGLKLDGAKKSLNGLSAAGKRFSLAGIANGVAAMGSKFTALGVIGVTALANIANKAVNTGLTVAKSLTIDPVLDGFREYETQMNAIQTILSNTKKEGSNLGDVTGALDDLNTYADKTIYNFTEMARNIGTFTAAGVDLETSTGAIKGIANVAAVSGSNSQQASTAMYQLSQALSTGKVKLMDWNSVSNAGMGGQVFKDAIVDTARVHGVKVDEMIEKSGSFRESLSEGWFTSEILTDTLKKFTGEMSDAELKAEGYSKSQIKAIQEMAKTAVDAATKVKTFTQLIDTLQEAAGSGWAKTWQLLFGDFNEAKEVFTQASETIGGMIEKSSKARNTLISDWKDLGGRIAVIDTIKNVFSALMAFIKPIKEAFREIFPATTAKQLFSITEAIRDFSAKLKMGAGTADKVKRTFKGVFAVLDIGWMIIKGLAGVFVDLFSAIMGGSGTVLDITAGFGDFLVSIRDAIKNGDGLTKFFEGLSKIVRAPIEILKILGRALVGLFDGMDFSAVGKGMKNMLGRLNPLGGAIDAVSGFAKGLFDIIKKVFAFAAPALSAIKDAFSELGGAIVDAFSSMDFSGVLDVINTGLFGALIVIMKKFFDGGLFSAITGGNFMDGLGDMFEGLTGSLEAMQMKLKADALIRIAGALGILTISVVALSMIDSAKLTKALTAITVMFTQLGAAMKIFEVISSGKGMLKLPAIAAGLIILSIAIGVLTISVSALSKLNWNELAKGLTGVVVLLGALAGAAKLMSGHAGGLIAAGIGMIAVSVAIKILASAVRDFSSLSWGEMIQGLAGVGATLAALAIFTKLSTVNKGAIGSSVGLILLGVALKIIATVVSDFAAFSVESLVKGLGAIILVLGALAAFNAVTANGAKMILTATGMVILGAAITIIAGAVSKFAEMSWGELIKGLVGMAGALVIITAAMWLLPPNMLVSAAAMVVVSAALVILAGALQTLGGMGWEEIAKALVTLAGSLIIIAGAMILMTTALPGAAALFVIAAAFTALAPALVLMGQMTWGQIARGLTMLAASIVIIALGGVLLTPVVPTFFLLGAAAVLLGTGAMLAGAGVSAFAVGITALAGAGAAAVTVIVSMVKKLAALIPYVMQQVGNGLVAFANVIARSVPAFARAMTAVIMSLLKAINTTAPAVIRTLIRLVNMMVNALVRNVPKLVRSGMKLLLGILRGIRDNIGKIVSVVADIITRFLNALAAKMPGIVRAGTNLVLKFMDGIQRSIPRLTRKGADMIISFVNSLARTIRSRSADMRAAGKNIAGAIISGMTGGLGSGISKVASKARSVARSALNSAKSLLGINSPSKEFLKLGRYSNEGFAIGLTKYAKLGERASEGVGKTAMNTLRDTVSNIGNIVSDGMDTDPTIRPVLDLSSIERDSRRISGMFNVPTVSVDSSYAKASVLSRSSLGRNATLEEARSTSLNGPGKGVVFNQYNNSPKTLSRAEIYRQTKNQLSVVKG